MKKALKILLIGTILFLWGVYPFPAVAGEPSMVDYTSYPIFMTQQVKPNIMIIMDNSGSMNYNAYGVYNGDDNIVTGENFVCGKLDIPVIQSIDDAEEGIAPGDTSWYSNSDLDLGSYSPEGAASPCTSSSGSVVGLRFMGLSIPQGATITNAYITFQAEATSCTTPADTHLTFWAQAIDDAGSFPNDVDELSSRPVTTASVTWNDVESWTQDLIYQSPDLTALVQEIVNRPGWVQNSSMAFIIKGTGKRDAKAYDYGDHTHGPVLHIEYSGCKEFYGYFDLNSRYSYASSIFSRDPNGPWHGNFLNWLTMRRIDIARKVMMGGLANPRTLTGTQKLTGEDSPDNRTFIKEYDGTNPDDGTGGAGVTPYNDATYTYVMDKGNFYVYEGDYDFYETTKNLKATYSIVVEKVAAEEPQDFEDLDGAGLTTVGVFQRFGTQARWGNLWFTNNGTGNNGNGGFISNPVEDNITANFINDLQNKNAETWTPLAEAYYTTAMYFKQDAIASSLEYLNNPGTTAFDPYDGSEYCAKSFVIMITDGASTKDGMIPSSLTDYADSYDSFVAGDHVVGACDESTGAGCEYGSGGTDYLKDVALWARTTDLRPDSDADGLPDPQNLILYTVYAFGNEENARNLLKEAAKNGGFEDRDGDNVPDGGKDDLPDDRLEWDKNGDGDPDTYFEASDGRTLERQLGKAIRDILERASSGTAASVLATNSEGEGNMIQAYFRPTMTTTTNKKSSIEVTWTGFLQSLWMDPCGNLREDANGNRKMDLEGAGVDPIIEYYFDEATNETKIKKYTSHPQYTKPYECEGSSTDYDLIGLDEIIPLFEAGRMLALADPADRKIFTYMDNNDDGVVDEATYDNFDGGGEVISLETANSAALAPYLGVLDGSVWSYLGDSHQERLDDLINYIRGVDKHDALGNSILRNRTTNQVDALNPVNDGKDFVWKLGDIVHSTPVSVAKPMDNYHIIYSDPTYQVFFDKMRDRETVVYTGANDGMLHAFTSWKYDASTRTYECPLSSCGAIDTTPGVQMGSELWAYIPQVLLPHLKWLADPAYTHVYYVDMKPKVFDAKILPDDTHYSDSDSEKNWGTFLIVGLNLGGKRIWTNEFGATGTDTRHFAPTYVCIDITEPRDPVLMWERSYSGLNLSQSSPAVIKVEDKWFAVFGSGPTDYNGTSTETSKVFVVDLKTGEPYTSGADDWLYDLCQDNAFLNSPAALDKGLNYNVDSIYFGETHCASAACDSPKQFQGRIYKIPVNCTKCDWNNEDPEYVDDPTLWPGPSILYEASTDNPITAPVSLSVDVLDNVWVYFGTGRYLRDEDKETVNQEYLIGLKDPFFNEDYKGSYYHDFAQSKTLTKADLFVADGIEVTTAGYVFKSGSPYGGSLGNSNWSDLLDDARVEDGWIRSLALPATGPSERAVSKSTVLGGVVLMPTFIPNPDPCGFGGNTSFYGVYYETGTPFYKHVFSYDGATITYGADTFEKTSVKLTSTSVGAPPPSIGIHVGREGGVHGGTAYLQLSTGEMAKIELNTPLPIKSGMSSWNSGGCD